MLASYCPRMENPGHLRINGRASCGIPEGGSQDRNEQVRGVRKLPTTGNMYTDPAKRAAGPVSNN